METDELKTNSKEQVVNGNEKDPKHTISIECSIEVTGEDEPTKCDKRRGFWSCMVVLSIIAFFVSLLFVWISSRVGIPPFYSCFAALASIALFITSLCLACDIGSEESAWPMPWYYGGL